MNTMQLLFLPSFSGLFGWRGMMDVYTTREARIKRKIIVRGRASKSVGNVMTEEVGMIDLVSIGDIVCAVVREHRCELTRLDAYIQGGYYMMIDIFFLWLCISGYAPQYF